MLRLLILFGLAFSGQHTFSGEVRSIAVCGPRVWAASGGGLSAHAAKSGAFLFKLTSADGLPGNSLKLAACLDDDRVLAGGEFGAVVVEGARRGRPGRGLRLRPVAGLSRPGRYTPVVAALPPGPQAQGWLLLSLQQGLLALERRADGYRARPTGAAKGWWQAAACTASRCALGDRSGAIELLAPGSLLQPGPGPEPVRRLWLDGPVLALAARGEELLVATGDELLRLEGNRLRPLLLQAPDGRPERVRATALAGDRAGLLVGTADGRVLRLEGDELRLLAASERGRVRALAPGGPRRPIFLGLGREGLVRLVPGADRPGPSLGPAGEICDNHVTHLARHRRWLVAGTFDRGACVLGRHGWRRLAGLPSPLVLGLASDGRDLYVATSSGIARFGPRLRPRPIGPRDAKTLRWLATEGATSAVALGPGRVALSSRFGVVRVSRRRRGRTRVRFLSHERGAPWKMTGLAAAPGALFAASETQGVVRLPLFGRPAWHLQDPRPLAENWVTAVAAVSADELWVAHCQRGAVHVKGRSHRRLGAAQGLPDERLTAVAADERGAFLGTLGGLAWAGADGGPIERFGLAQGLPDPRVAGLLLEGPELWVGTEAGLARFRRTPADDRPGS